MSNKKTFVYIVTISKAYTEGLVNFAKEGETALSSEVHVYDSYMQALEHWLEEYTRKCGSVNAEGSYICMERRVTEYEPECVYTIGEFIFPTTGVIVHASLKRVLIQNC